MQTAGVVVFPIGLPAMFHSVGEGSHPEPRAMVIGYVVMRNVHWSVPVRIGWVVAGFAPLTLGEGVVGTVASSGDLLGGAAGTHWSLAVPVGRTC
ncbi:hypothetical protein [Streptomyces marokkonensis]|uniref:hypothetical protein n=1 Tax=Streptomyces marokkonensis TaxID=324855 RepID=UPI001FCBDF74|nr:hypothetical protein [Streptomyces marokkonensis]